MIDFKEIAAKSSLYNFHSHTQYCDGRAPMEDFAAKAVINAVKTLRGD